MKSTQRYGIEYPAPTDLVSGASDQFERMANSMEKAMAGVDDRVIQNATLPVVRGTLAELNSAQGVDGQTGLVTQETDNVTAYVRQGTSWLALCTRAWHETLKTAVTAVQNAVSTLTTRVTTAEQNIGQRVTTSTFNSKVTDLQNQVNALKTHAYASVRFARLDGQLQYNKDSTFMKLDTLSGDIKASIKSNARGGYLTGLPAGWYWVKAGVRIDNQSGSPQWTRLKLEAVGNASIVGLDTREGAFSGYSTLEVSVMVKVNDTNAGISPMMFSQAAGVLREKGILAVVRIS